MAVVAARPVARVFHFWNTLVSQAGRLRDLVWLGSSLDDVRAFPEDVRQVMGFALYLAQAGGKHVAARPLRGFGGAGVLEVADDHLDATYRTVYTVRFKDAVYVLHAFKKKAKRGRATPQREMNAVRRRLVEAGRLSAQRLDAMSDDG